jgi:hypothetical protein
LKRSQLCQKSLTPLYCFFPSSSSLSLSLLTSLLFLTSELSSTFSDLLFLHHIFLGKEKAHVIVHFTTMEVKPLQIVPSSHNNNNNTTGFIPLFFPFYSSHVCFYITFSYIFVL